MKEQKKYDREFKINAVKLYRESGKTLEELGKDLGVPKTTFYSWVREFKEQGEASFPGKGKLSPCNEELYRLKKQLAEITMRRDILKKGNSPFLKTKRMRFEFMKAHAQEFPVEKMAEILKVSRSGYYEFLNRKPSKRALDNEALIEEIRNVHRESRGTYGSARVHLELKKRGKKCSRKRVANLMKKEKI